jgi:hypothetical protein
MDVIAMSTMIGLDDRDVLIESIFEKNSIIGANVPVLHGHVCNI